MGRTRNGSGRLTPTGLTGTQSIWCANSPDKCCLGRKLTRSLPFGICGEDVILGGGQGVACGSALRILRLWRLAGHRGWLEPGRGVIVEHGISPSVRVRESVVVLLNQLDLDEVTRHLVRGARGKRR